MDIRRKQIPSLIELLAFECAARHASFTRAAEELRQTQGAISRQIRALEQTLGARLFERIRRQVVLTEVGLLYLAEVRKALGLLSQAGDKVALFGAGEVLNLAVLPTFATRWLIPRVARFLNAQPGLTLNFMVRLEPFSFAAEPFDLAVHFGTPDWPGADAQFLCREECVPVASPALCAAAALATPADLARVARLHQTTRAPAWELWFRQHGLDVEGAGRGARFDQFAMIAAAAVAGMGVALLPRFLIAEELAAGRLALLPGGPLESREAYWLMVPESRRSHPGISALRAWMVAEAA